MAEVKAKIIYTELLKEDLVVIRLVPENGMPKYKTGQFLTIGLPVAAEKKVFVKIPFPEKMTAAGDLHTPVDGGSLPGPDVLYRSIDRCRRAPCLAGRLPVWWPIHRAGMVAFSKDQEGLVFQFQRVYGLILPEDLVNSN